MQSTLILNKTELNPDVFFADPSKWNIGSDWTVFLNGEPGAILTAATGTPLDLATDVLKSNREYKYTLYVESASGSNTFLIIAGNLINIGMSATPVVYEGVVTTVTGLASISFIGSGGESAVINYLKISESPDKYSFDLSETIEVPITYQIADIRDPSKRNASFSKTVKLPGSKNNDQYFSQIFEIGGDGSFNPNKKVKAIVVNDGVEVFNGIAQLKNIIRDRIGDNDYDLVTYELTLLGKLADIFYALGDTLLSDLDYSEFNHLYNIANERNSWYTSIIKDNVPYINTTSGANLTIIGCQNSVGRVQINFSGAHGLVAGDYLLIPEGSLSAGSLFYLGEHEVYSVVSSTSVILRCPFDILFATPSNTTLTSIVGPNGAVRKHIKNGEGYVYPMNNYSAGVDGTWHVTNFYPALYVKQYIDKMFKKVGFIYDSNYFNSTMFKKMIIPYNGGELKLTQDQIDAKKFRASSTAVVTGTYLISPAYDNSGFYSGAAAYRGHAISGFGVGPTYTPFSNTLPITLDVPIDDATTVPNFNTGGTFNTGSYRWICPTTGTYDLNVQAQVINKYTLPGGVTQQNTTDTPPTGINTIRYNININQSGQPTWGGGPQMQLVIWDFTANNPVSLGVTTINGLFNTPTTTNIIITGGTYIAGRQYGVKLIYTLPARGQFWTTAFTTPYSGNITMTYEVAAGCTFKNDVPNAAIGDGDLLLMNMCIPQKIKCRDFLGSIVKMFNLYIETDKDNDKKLYIEPRNDFYNLGTDIDWSQKYNIDQPMTILPMGELNAKTYDYKYEKDPSTFGKDHVDKYGTGYGDRNYEIDNDFINGNVSTSLIFASTVLSEVTPYAGTDRILSLTSGDALRILYFNMSSTSTTANTWNHTGTGGPITSRIFPYAGHLDKVEAPNYDLNWGFPKGTYFTPDSWTNRNLFQQYYFQMIQEITDKNSKIITVYLRLTAYDIFKLDFRNRFIIDGHYLRLNKISDYSVTKNVPVLCEFVKIENKPRFVPKPYTQYEAEDPVYDQSERLLNGQGFPDLALYGNTSNYMTRGSNINVNGQGNNVNQYGSRNISVQGDDNYLGNNLTNVTIEGNNNVVYPDLSNIALYNTSGVTVTESNVVYINGIKINATGALLNTNINTLDAGQDNVLTPFNEAKTINLVNGSVDSVMELGSHDLSNDIDAGLDTIINT